MGGTGLSRDLWDLSVTACRSQLPAQGLNPCLLHWEFRVLTTGPPGKSCFFCLFKINLFLSDYKAYKSVYRRISDAQGWGMGEGSDLLGTHPWKGQSRGPGRVVRGWGGDGLLGRNTPQGKQPHTKGWSLVSLPLEQQETRQVCRAESRKSPFMGRASCPGGWVAVGVESSLLSPTLPWGESGELSWWWWPQQRDLVELGVTLDYPQL